MTEEIRKLKEIIDGSDNIVFFGGAGVSTESGIPDFRSVDGLYRQQWSDPPETILSHTYYERYPEKFFAFLCRCCRAFPLRLFHIVRIKRVDACQQFRTGYEAYFPGFASHAVGRINTATDDFVQLFLFNSLRLVLADAPALHDGFHYCVLLTDRIGI